MAGSGSARFHFFTIRIISIVPHLFFLLFQLLTDEVIFKVELSDLSFLSLTSFLLIALRFIGVIIVKECLIVAFF